MVHTLDRASVASCSHTLILDHPFSSPSIQKYDVHIWYVYIYIWMCRYIYLDKVSIYLDFPKRQCGGVATLDLVGCNPLWFPPVGDDSSPSWPEKEGCQGWCANHWVQVDSKEMYTVIFQLDDSITELVSSNQCRNSHVFHVVLKGGRDNNRFLRTMQPARKPLSQADAAVTKNLFVVWLHRWLHHTGQVTYVWTSTSQNIRSRGPSPFLGHLVLHFCDTKDFEGIRDGRAIAARLAIAGPTFPGSHGNHVVWNLVVFI